MELTQEQQVEYNELVEELVAKGGPTMGQIKKCGLKVPEKVARLIELGWVEPATKGEGEDAIDKIEGEYRADSCGECLKFETPNCVDRVSDELACSDFSPKPAAVPTSLTEITQLAIKKAFMCPNDGVKSDDKAAIEIAAQLEADIDAFLEAEWNIEIAKASETCIHIENRVRKRNTFLADSVRNDNDMRFLNAEIGQRKYKGKIASITTVKHCVVSAEGEWVTEFDIEMKE